MTRNDMSLGLESLGPGTVPSESAASRLDSDNMEPIAVIGFSARLPQDGETTDGFWRMICEGRSAATDIPKERFNVDAFYHPDVERIDTMNVKSVNFLRGDIAAFDAPFFSIQPSEVVSMDPQQRCMLEASFRAFENAGLTMDSVAGSQTSVFVGNSARDYEALLLRDPESPAKYIGTGIGTSMLANRGLVGGCNLILAPDVSIVPLTNMGFFSPDGKCFSFDHRANGYAKGEGAGFVLIKRFADALSDGDTIRAVIRSTGVNQDGKTPGLTQPSQRSQEENIKETYRKAGLNMDTTQYFESHGTGTQVGDPIEAGAINAAFRRTPVNPLYVGALKPNIGHLEAASSIAALIKSIMILETGLIPPNINFERPNVNIPIQEWHIKFPLKLIPFPTNGTRRISINSFGYGGSNAHAILDDAFHYMKSRGIQGMHNTAPLPPEPESLLERSKDFSSISTDECKVGSSTDLPACPLRILAFSAVDEDGVKRLATVYQAYFSNLPAFREIDPKKYLDDLSYTLSRKRNALPWKSFILTRSLEELRQDVISRMSKPIRSSTGPALSFIFTGQGVQWAGMGRELSVYPIFRSSLVQSHTIIRNLGCSWDLFDIMWPSGQNSAIDNPEMAQSLCTALQIALVDLLTSWHIVPIAVVGHSSGEIAAAYCAGSLSHESAVKVSFYRGLLAARLERQNSKLGAMTSVGLSESAVAPFISEVNAHSKLEGVQIGCINSPYNVTITGHRRGIDAINALMDKEGIFARRLQVSVAYHSHFMIKVANEYATLIRDIVPRTAPTSSLNGSNNKRPEVFSSVDGAIVEVERMSQAGYWVQNLVSKVRFSEALKEMTFYLVGERAHRGTSKDILMEIGPTSALQRPVKETVKDMAQVEDVHYETILKRDVSATESCLGLIGRLWSHGSDIDLVLVNCPIPDQSKLQLLVDLPAYPFNHSNSYWTESRISKKFRLRKHARHDLLGTPSADWNPYEPKWRNIIRVKENPWIVDHVIQDLALYPAAGMIVMAIEGARQMTDPAKVITGYNIRQLYIYKALLVTSAAEGVESQLHFHPDKSIVNGESSETSHFMLYAYLNEEWDLICEGKVAVKFEESHNGVSSDQDILGKQPRPSQIVTAGVKNCKEIVNTQQLYRNLASFGFKFGTSFQTLDSIKYGEMGEASATIRLHGWRQKTGNIYSSEYVIHPTSLDGVLHLTMVALSKGGWQSIPTYVPTQAESLWISNDLLTGKADAEVEVYTKKTFDGYREAEFRIAAVDVDQRLLIEIEGWRMTALSALESSSSKGPGLQCYNIEWKLDPMLTQADEITRYCESYVSGEALLPEAIIDRWELVCLYFMSAIVGSVPQYERKDLAPHLRKYLEWTQSRFNQARLDDLLSKDACGSMLRCGTVSREKFLSDFEESSAEGALIVAVGRNVRKVLDGEVDALDLLFSTSLVQNFYHSPSFGVSYRKIAAYVDLLAHKNPSFKVLEIGAGTGSATGVILRALCSGDEQDGIPRFSQYTYTDISPAFFQDAKERFKNQSDRMTFSTLDIEKDPLDQGFEAGQYDLIFCGLVLHATASVDTSLQNIRKILKPGGKLILFEPSEPETSRVSFVFGLLPGWWLGTEEKRRQGPLLSDSDWHEALLAAGFSGADITFPDYRNERHTFSAIISTAREDEKKSTRKRKIIIVIQSGIPQLKDLAMKVESTLLSKEAPPSEICTLGELPSRDLKNSYCICLLETEIPFLTDMSYTDFMILKEITSSTEGVLWATQGCGERAQRPEMGLATGFGRNMDSEEVKKSFVELALETDISMPLMVQHIVGVFQQSFLFEAVSRETEYMQQDGSLCLSRIVKASHMSQMVAVKTLRQEPRSQSLGSEPHRHLELSIRSPGQLDTLEFKDEEHYTVSMACHELEIKVEAASLDPVDGRIVSGQLMGDTLGHECAGVVIRTGENTEDFQLGDRVLCYTNEGAFKTHVQVRAAATAKIPNGLSFCDAAAIPAAFCTAYGYLIRWANLKEGESIYINSGINAIGQAAVQIAKLHNANVFVSIDTENQKEHLINRYGLPKDDVYCKGHKPSTATVMPKIKSMDVVFDLGEKKSEETWSYIKPFGRFIEFHTPKIRSDACQIPSNISFISADLGQVLRDTHEILGTTMRAVEKLMTASRITAPQPLHVYNISNIEEAFREVQNPSTTGKVVVEMDQGATVRVLPSLRPSYSFDPEATYLISGGLGGLGRSIVRWMADRQARYFALLSRSGAKDSNAIELIEEMKLRSVKITAPPCDISDEQALTATLEKIKGTIPPVKGCIQASMVLNDGLFENMSLGEFNATIRPKVQGSWHLHKHLPQGLDFFILLSSITGVVGSRGQRNYACGNTYQNALARHRVSQGQKCISLDLGSILSIGFAAERDLSAALEKDGFQGIRKTEFFALLEHCCDPSLPVMTPQESQIITGIGAIEHMSASRLQEVYWTKKPLFSILRQHRRPAETPSSSTSASSNQNYGLQITNAATHDEAEKIILQALREKLAAGLSVPVEDIDAKKVIHSFGIDSLVALDLRYWFLNEMKANVTIFEIMQSRSVLDLGKCVAGKSEYRRGGHS